MQPILQVHIKSLRLTTRILFILQCLFCDTMLSASPVEQLPNQGLIDDSILIAAEVMRLLPPENHVIVALGPETTLIAEAIRQLLNLKKGVANGYVFERPVFYLGKLAQFSSRADRTKEQKFVRRVFPTKSQLKGRRIVLLALDTTYTDLLTALPIMLRNMPAIEYSSTLSSYFVTTDSNMLLERFKKHIKPGKFELNLYQDAVYTRTLRIEADRLIDSQQPVPRDWVDTDGDLDSDEPKPSILENSKLKPVTAQQVFGARSFKFEANPRYNELKRLMREAHRVGYYCVMGKILSP